MEDGNGDFSLVGDVAAADLRCLSGRQPWWWAILEADKRIENRVVPWRYRGPILLHAAKGCSKMEYAGAVASMENAGVLERCGENGERRVISVPPLAQMPRSGIVGYAEIVGRIEPMTQREAIRMVWPGVDPRWHFWQQYGYVLANVTKIPFVPIERGMLGLWRPTRQLLARLEEAWKSDWLRTVVANAERAGVTFKEAA